MAAFFETKALSVGYQGNCLIHGIDLTVERGEIVTLIGPNGAGKSTILKTLTKQLEPLGGVVYLDGRSLAQLSYKELAQQQAVLLTQRVEPELMTCWEVVAAGRYPYTGRMGLLTAQDEAIGVRAMEAMTVLDLAQRPFSAISDGQRQRVLLARAICQEPRLLVLDEPTSFLDVRHKLELLALLRKMAREQGLSVLLSLHEIDLAQKVSDKLLCVKGEEISFFGTPEEVFQAERIQELYELEPGAYNTAFGSLELSRPKGEPQVLVLSGGGGGIPLFRRLQREDRPFAAAILYENDVELPLARALAAQVVTERPFGPMGQEAFQRARQLLERCQEVWAAELNLGPWNQPMAELVALARQEGKLRAISQEKRA